MADTFQSLAASVSDAQVKVFQQACNTIVEWLVQGFHDGAFSLLDVASRAAHWDVLVDALAQGYANGYLTALQIAQIAANFIQSYS
jgi:hypothetical protein